MNLNFPDLPNAKIYGVQMTPELHAQMKLVNGEKLTQNDEIALKESIAFYKIAFEYLRNIDFSQITDENVKEIISYLDKVLNINLRVTNAIHFTEVWRVTFVKNDFLEEDKLRNTKFLSYPPIDIIRNNGFYGRANTPNSTILYCAANQITAILETKPKVGERIIITKWVKIDDKPFMSYPIVNNKTIDNDGLKKGTKAFQEIMKYNHPLFAEILDLYFDFLSSEFIKNTPITSYKKYEYIYSSYFAEKVLENRFEPVENPVEPISDYDCIIYPSVAYHYREENIGVVPSSVKRLCPFYAQDCIVTETMYDNLELNADDTVVKFNILRSSTKIVGGKIIWEDD